MIKRILLNFFLLSLSLSGLAQPIPLAKARQWLHELSYSRADSNRVLLLLQLAAYYQLKPGEEKADIDSALLMTGQAETLSRKIGFPKGTEQATFLTCRIDIEISDSLQVRRLYPELSDSNKVKVLVEEGIKCLVYDPAGYKDSLTRMTSQALRRAETSPYPRIKNFGFELGALYYLEYNEPEKSKEYLHSCFHFFDSTGDVQTRDDIADRSRLLYIFLIQDYFFRGDLYGALNTGNTMMDEIAWEARPNKNDFPCLWTLANIYSQMGMRQKSLDFCQKALNNIGPIVSDQGAGGTLENKAKLKAMVVRTAATNLWMMGEVDSALAVVNSLETELPQGQEEPNMIMAMSKGECLMAKKEYRSAEQWLLAGLKMGSRKDGPDANRIYLPLAKLYVVEGDFRKGKACANRWLQLHKGQNKPFEQRDIHYLLYQVDSAEGNLLSALANLKQYNYLNDSLFGVQKSAQLVALQLNHATETAQRDMEAKEQHIQLLEKDRELERSRLRAARTFRNMVIGGTVLLLLLLGVLYNRYRIKQRGNLLLQAAIDEKDGLLAEKDDLLIEKDWLMKEVHHRVKNNLQIVVSLLNMAGKYIDNADAMQAIQESQHRLYAMSLIHQKLYTTENMELVEMGGYIRDLVAYLNSSYNLARRIVFELELEQIPLEGNVAVPVGLILNEAITNSIKHAFPGNRPGVIRIGLSAKDLPILKLYLSDDGIGLPEEKLSLDRHVNGMGINLIKALTNQIHGRLQLVNNGGLSITIRFPADGLTVL